MKIKITRRNYPFYIISILSLILIFYTSARAATLSFTHDESTTFLWFVPQTFMQIVSCHLPKAGNHIINTLAIKLFITVFPDTDFYIRLPNLIAHLIYIIFSILILKRFNSVIILIFGFILINFNPYMLDFFSLARGYGMSMGFMMVSIYCFFKYIDKNKMRMIYISLAFAVFAVLSNFVLIHFYLALILAYNLARAKNNENPKGFIKYNIPALVITLLLGIILFEPIRKLSKGKEFYIGGDTGFYHDTMISFINAIKYNQNYGAGFIKVTAIGIVLFIGIAIIITVYKMIKYKNQVKDSTAAIFLIFLLSPVISTILQHYILGSQFLTYRLTLFFFPILGFTIAAFINSIFNKIIKPGLHILLVIISFSFLFHTFKCANFECAIEWKYDANTKNMVFELDKIIKNNPNSKKIKLGINWLFEPTINFYRTTRKLDWLEEVTREGIDGDYDYYYILEEQLPELNSPEIIKKYDVSNTLLAQ